MKRIIPFFLIILFASGVFAQDGTLTVTVLSSEAGTGLTEIEYEFTGDAGNYDILVEVDFDDGEGFRIISIDDLSGNWKNVTPGGPYSITWDGMSSFPETYSEETVIRLTAEFVYFLSIQSEPSAGGTATDVTNTGPYKEGTVVEIKAEPNTGYAFEEWTATGGSFGDTEEEETTFTMPAENVTITANFCIIPGSPSATNATNISASTFTANWTAAVPGALNYTLDVALDEHFDSFVDGYEGLDVGDVTSHTVVGLVSNTTYYYRVKVTDACGESDYSDAVSVTTTSDAAFTCGNNITFSYRGSPVIYGTIERGGLCWMDRNLGAEPMPFVPAEPGGTKTDTRLYGDLFQWGRSEDGHQLRDPLSETTAGPTTDPNPGINFITVTWGNWYDGTNPDDLWQEDGTGANNPCPPGWRVPTADELDAERMSWTEGNNSAGAYASTLKWPVGGFRRENGTFDNIGTHGYVWSSSVSGDFASYLWYHSSNAGMFTPIRAYGVSVRCVRPVCDLPPAPTATDATGISTSTFTAHWDAVPGAVTYTLDVARDEDFNTFVEDYEALDVCIATSYTVEGLDPSTTYYYRVTATDDCGPSGYSNIISVNTDALPFSCPASISFTYRGSNVTYNTVVKDYGGTIGKRCWMDRNLGASRVPTSSTDSEGYGHLFQWGRLDDGHQVRNSGTTPTQSSNPNPGHSNFIIDNANWYSGSNPAPNDLWKEDGTGTNNPCPPGWRVPTEAELNAERLSWGTPPNTTNAFNSDLKWPVGGYRFIWGTVSEVGNHGYVWSCTTHGDNQSRGLLISSDLGSYMATSDRAMGLSVRCVKDN